MSRRNVFLFILSVLLIILPVSVFAEQGNNGVDDLRGRWDFTWAFDGDPEYFQTETLYINDIVQDPEDASLFLANGCIEAGGRNATLPVTVQAYYDSQAGTYEWTVYTSLLFPDEGAFVIRFDGLVEIFGSGVTDDAAEGELTTGFDTGFWTGVHHDRRRVICPGIPQVGLFQGEVYSHHDTAFSPQRVETFFETYTPIVSSAMLVDDPFGGTTLVEFYTDIFSPDVNFIDQFRFLDNFPGSPAAGLVYTFTLLDIFGDPIAGAVSTDVWNRCNQGAPADLNAEYPWEDDLELSWTAVPTIPFEFDPSQYQITVWPQNEQGTEYGSDGVMSAFHYIPWDPFVPGQPGNPDGYDYGQSLSEFEDGLYEINVWAWNEADYANGGWGSDCAVRDSAEALFVTKEGSDLYFFQPGTITGVVTDEGGSPIEGIQVDACEYDNDFDPYCAGGITGPTGAYFIFGLPDGDYRVNVWNQPGWANEFYDDTPFWELADRVPVSSGVQTSGIDFALSQGGSISGTVYDAFGNPLANIAVDTETGGFGTCTDENGEYFLLGAPLGTYNISAGRDFCGPHAYIEQVYENVTIDSGTPDQAGIDFYLEEGGSVSGVVTDGAAAPLEGLEVVACEYDNDIDPFCKGGATASDGSYTISGLPAGDYRVGIWGQPGWAGEFFDDEPDYNLAVRVTVAAGADTGGIDFALAPGGSISGTVTDVDGNPLGGIAVDIEEGGFGTCTDAGGNYTMEGIPYGTYNVVAGRDFCDPHPYAEETIFGISIDGGSPDAGGVDFSLTVP